MSRTTNARAGTPPAARARRTQAERSAETRRKIIEATMACMAESGVGQTTMSRIAARAGVTWGAIQHHFGDKAAIVFAGVEQALEDIAADVELLVVEGDTVRNRVRRFLNAAWRVGYDGEAQRSAFLVFMTIVAEQDDRTTSDPHVVKMATSLRDMWNRIFADFDLEPARLARAQRLAFATMSGLAFELAITGRDDEFGREFGAIETMLVSVLTGDDAA